MIPHVLDFKGEPIHPGDVALHATVWGRSPKLQKIYIRGFTEKSILTMGMEVDKNDGTFQKGHMPAYNSKNVYILERDVPMPAYKGCNWCGVDDHDEAPLCHRDYGAKYSKRRGPV